MTSPYWASLTAAGVKTLKGINTSADDTLLQNLCDACATWIETWLNRTLLSTAYTELYDGNCKRAILLDNVPVTAVASVSVNGIPLTAVQPNDFSSTGFKFDQRKIFLQGDWFQRGMQNVSVVYTAGYAAIPLDLIQAAQEAVLLKYQQRLNIGIQSKTLATEVISFVQSDFPQSTLKLLQNYRRVVPAFRA